MSKQSTVGWIDSWIKKLTKEIVVIMRRIIKQLAAEEIYSSFLQHDQLQFLISCHQLLRDFRASKLHLKTNLQQPTTYLSLEAAAKWWWVWALCAMQACGMKKEERRETRQDKRRRAIRVGMITVRLITTASVQLYMKYAPLPFVFMQRICKAQFTIKIGGKTSLGPSYFVL